MGHIGRNIKKIRNIKGLSQQAFADLFALTRGNISSYEELRAEPKIDTVVQIANFFSIPLDNFIQKDLSVNELLHYNTGFVLETEKLKINQQLINVPFVPALYLDDYPSKHQDADFMGQLPHITIPCNSKFPLLAFEIGDQETLPSECSFINGDVLIFEKVSKENIHRIVNRMGLMIDNIEIKNGIYKQENDRLILSLNELVTYPFDIDKPFEYWVLRAAYTQIS